MVPAFRMWNYTTSDKEIQVLGPGELTFWIDYDDVNHPIVEAQAKKMVEILNREWDK